VNSAFGDNAGHFLGRRGGGMHQLVALHVLLAAKSLSTNIAVVKGGCVAPLMNKKVVRF